MLGEEGTEQFGVTTWVDDKLIRTQKIHDPFIFCRTEIGISRWDLFKGLFRKQFKIKVVTSVNGTLGAVRSIMTLDLQKLQEISEQRESTISNEVDQCQKNLRTA